MKRKLWIALAVFVGVGAFVIIWFQPQKLFIDDRVSESDPITAPIEADGSPAPAEDEPGEEGPRVVAAGRFVPLDHDAMGKAIVIETGDGRSILRFEEFEVENGPDLRVYLSTAPPKDEDAHADDFIDLGGLKGNIGEQNYAIPPGTDLSKYTTAVVWCRRFSVGFAAAALESA